MCCLTPTSTNFIFNSNFDTDNRKQRNLQCCRATIVDRCFPCKRGLLSSYHLLNYQIAGGHHERLKAYLTRLVQTHVIHVDVAHIR